MELTPGRRVTESLRLVRLLGKGGMGSVWIADHLALHTQVAVKFMSTASLEDPTLITRFTREATAAAQIKSPHVVQTLDHGVMLPERVPFIVMELLEGEDLATRLKRLGPLPLTEIVTIVAQTAKALSKAHQAGIIHRDIKPDNLFLVDMGGDLFVKVLDFGVAKRASDTAMDMTSTGSTVGTPYYMSPEQLLSAKHVDFRCDLWSLAIVTYRMLTGRLPFKGATLGALSVALHQGVFELPGKLRPDVSPALDAWFARAMNREPEARFEDLRSMLDALAEAVRAPPASGALPLELGPLPTYLPTPASMSAPLRPSHPSAPAIAAPVIATPTPVPSSPALLAPVGSPGDRPPSFTGSTVTHAGSARARGPLVLLGGSVAFLVFSAGLTIFLVYRAVLGRPDAVASPASTTVTTVTTVAPASPSSVAPTVGAPVSSIVNTGSTPDTMAPPALSASASAAPSAPRALPRPLATPARKSPDRGF